MILNQSCMFIFPLLYANLVFLWILLLLTYFAVYIVYRVFSLILVFIEDLQAEHIHNIHNTQAFINSLREVGHHNQWVAYHLEDTWDQLKVEVETALATIQEQDAQIAEFKEQLMTIKEQDE